MTKKTSTIALTFGIPWAVIMIISTVISGKDITVSLIISTIVTGLISGVLFAVTIQFLAKRFLKKIIIETSPDEHVIKEGGANHFKGIEGVGGKLVLTDKRLLFKSHKLNIQNHQENFELNQIEKLQVVKKMWLKENCLVIELPDSKTHKFIVDEPRKWMDMILDGKRASA